MMIPEQDAEKPVPSVETEGKETEKVKSESSSRINAIRTGVCNNYHDFYFIKIIDVMSY